MLHFWSLYRMLVLAVNRYASSGLIHLPTLFVSSTWTAPLPKIKISDTIPNKGRLVMRTVVFILLLTFLMLAALPSVSSATSESTDTDKIGPNQGLTLENIGRGIKSAAKNIEEEIPKIGPAIGETFKKVTGSDKEKDQPKTPSQSSGKPKK